MKLSERVRRMEPSATLAVVGKAKALKSQGKDVISFGAGEPDFASPPAAIAWAKDAMEQGKTHYTPAEGIPELKNAICGYYKNRFGLDYAPKQVVVGAGAKPIVYEALASIVDPGDDVVVIAPAWVSYVEQVQLFEGTTSVVETARTGYLPTPEAIEKAISPKTVAIILNSPCNPTGAVMDEELLRAIGNIAIRHDLWIVWDEIYERLVYEGTKHVNIVSVMPELASRTIIINGVSKAYAMTGWRIGYALGPVEIMAKIAAMQGHITSNPCSIAQWASVGAMQESEKDVESMRCAFEKRRELMAGLLSDMPHISFPKPMGAFYVMVNVEKCLGRTHEGVTLTNDAVFCERLLETNLVAAVPGSAFLAPGHLRFSYANATEEIVEGMKRFRKFLQEIA